MGMWRAWGDLWSRELRGSRGVRTNNRNCVGRKYAKGAPLGRAAFLLARVGVARAHEERTRDAQIVRGEQQVFSDGGEGRDFAGVGCGDGADVVDQVAGTRASAHNGQRNSV